jgi:hypothetical protein
MYMDRAEWDVRWPGDAGSWWLGDYPITVAWLTGEHRCLQCSYRFERGWLHPSGNPYPESVAVNVEVLWHWQDTHGFPREILLDMIAGSIGFRQEVA